MAEEIGGRTGGGLNGLHGSHAIFHHKGKLLAAGAISANARVGAERHLYSRQNCLAKVVALDAAKLGIVLKKVFGHTPVLSRLLNTFVIVDIHVEIGSVLFG